MLVSRTALTLVLLSTSCFAMAQDPHWSISAAPLFGQDWLGSEENRRGGYYSIGFSKPEPRFRFWGYDAEMEIEGYYMFTKGGAFRGWPDAGWPPDRSHHYGFLLISRYYQKNASSTRGFFEAGWGFQFTNQLTHDVDSRINSTPMIGLGVVFPFEEVDLSLGVRFFHISNAGTAGGNEGLNFFQYQLGIRF